MDHYAADASAVVEHLNLKNAVHIGHSTGGEAARYVARYGRQGRVAKAVLVSAVPPLMLKTKDNPGGTPIEVANSRHSAVRVSTRFAIGCRRSPEREFAPRGRPWNFLRLPAMACSHQGLMLVNMR